jgi:hypothetical protein
MNSNNASPYGFRIVGSCTNDRRLIDWPSAFVAYSQCDDRAEVNGEAYLSAFCFGNSFRDHLTSTGSTKGYAGECWAEWLWFDIDRDDIDAATVDARKLAATLCQRFELVGDDLLTFYSGSKGYHLGLPLSVCGMPAASVHFHSVCRRFAETVANEANVAIDSGVYDRVRAFRAPNSRHPKTSRHKRFVAFDGLMSLKASRIVELAETPEPFDIPLTTEPNGQAVRDWTAAAAFVDEQRATVAVRREGLAPATLNRATLEFMRDGATTGDRHRRLFSAAANLAEFGCSLELASALLTDAGLDSGLSPSEVRRQIECGLSHKGAI